MRLLGGTPHMNSSDESRSFETYLTLPGRPRAGFTQGVSITEIISFHSPGGSGGEGFGINFISAARNIRTDGGRERRLPTFPSHNELDGGWNNILVAVAPGYPVHRAAVC